MSARTTPVHRRTQMRVTLNWLNAATVKRHLPRKDTSTAFTGPVQRFWLWSVRRTDGGWTDLMKTGAATICARVTEEVNMKSVTRPAAISVLALVVSGGAWAAGASFHGRSMGMTMHPPATFGASALPSHAQMMGRKTAQGVSQTGQPNQTCGSASAPLTPGNAASAPGSAFNPDGKAGTVYAGQQPQNSVNPLSVSQYDVACARQP